jgi:hypothetical protein
VTLVPDDRDRVGLYIALSTDEVCHKIFYQNGVTTIAIPYKYTFEAD